MSRFSEGSVPPHNCLATFCLPCKVSRSHWIKFITPQQHSRTNQSAILDFIGGWSQTFRSILPTNPISSIGAAEDEIEVWVNRPRQYVDLLQTLTDETFTRDTGIKVNFHHA